MASASAHTRHVPPARRPRFGRLRLAVIALACAALIGVGVAGHGPTGTSAAFTDTGAGTAGFQAATAVAATMQPCTNNPDGNTVTISWTYTGPAPVSFDVYVNSTLIISTPPATRAVTLSGGGLLLLGLNQPITVRTVYSSTWTATSGSVPINVISLLGLAAVRCV